MENDVFISYSRKDYLDGDKIIPGNPISILQEEFKKNGISYWIDENGIYGGHEYLRDISEAIENSKILVFVSSKFSNESDFIPGEIIKANIEKKLIIPFKIDEFGYNNKVEIILLPLGCIYYSRNPKLALGKLIEAINKEKEKLTNMEKSELVVYKQNGKYGYKNRNTHEKIIPCKWSDAWEFNEEGLAIVRADNGNYGFINKMGVEVCSCKWKDAWPFIGGFACVKDEKGKWGFINKYGVIEILCKWNYADKFHEGLARVKNEKGKWGFIDETGKLIIKCKWKNAWSFRDGLALVENHNGKYGYIDKNGKVVIPCRWIDAWSFTEGLAHVTDINNNVHYIDRTGKILKTEIIN